MLTALSHSGSARHYDPAQRSVGKWSGTIVTIITFLVHLHVFETEIGAYKCSSLTLQAKQALSAVHLALNTHYIIRQNKEVESLPLS